MDAWCGWVGLVVVSLKMNFRKIRNPEIAMAKVHYFGFLEVELIVNVDFWILTDTGERIVRSREMKKRLLVDEEHDYGDRISPEMATLAREDFLQRGKEELFNYPGVIEVYHIVLKDYLVQKLPPLL